MNLITNKLNENSNFLLRNCNEKISLFRDTLPKTSDRNESCTNNGCALCRIHRSRRPFACELHVYGGVFASDVISLFGRDSAIRFNHAMNMRDPSMAVAWICSIDIYLVENSISEFDRCKMKY